ncbi:hypothetical protein NC653_014433 [Populus alba x Populus x berolinensis]|uniref:Uncharacterized protein n=1 Tax=Populus alba x Populus x berolinensis TaxID=444605 RepID=A0AAD6QX19_9ROSI|nr:hypothetical protein NC653_014433 [Populus alba x Populus x berolinensis]
MCQYRPWEDDSAQIEDYEQRTRNNTGHVDTRLEARVALLEARMANVEARVERLEAKMFFLQKGMRVVCALFLVTLAYALTGIWFLLLTAHWNMVLAANRTSKSISFILLRVARRALEIQPQ